MLRVLSILFGLSFILIGIVGFLPDYTPEGLLFGYLKVNPMLNFIHFVTGLLALFCGLSNTSVCKVFFIIFGFVYLAISAYGFYAGSGMLFDLIAINQADNIFHLVVALVSLFIGFGIRSRKKYDSR